MQDGKYTLRYISRYEEDLNEIVNYIVFKLHNPHSAMMLVDKIENAILERLNCPLSFEPFQSNRKRKNPYYRIYVENFTIYYVVIDDVMEVRRVLYKGRDAGKIIK
ncbi:MAG: type II toxin-antitoxin system RelE/ParE family toxin [Actinobacteria bacterium]|nr:type II toxin-antitoxin system RelE/ParE family toxin [Actinomycetota bacterium]